MYLVNRSSEKTTDNPPQRQTAPIGLDHKLIWDNHGCMPLRADASHLPQLERYRTAGVTVVSINVGFADIPWTEHVRVLSYMRRWIVEMSANFRLVAHVEDVQRCMADGKLGIVFDVEGMSAVHPDISLVQTFYELGVRWMLIAYNRNNAAGGGCLDADSGLTSVGRAIIDEMERVGMVLCLSHTGTRTASEALEYTRNPAILSHSNPYGLTPHPRNVSDDLMRACARTGGVVGLSGIGPFLGATSNLVERLLCHIRYVIDLIGPEHVGLGLDYVFDRAEMDAYVRAHPLVYPSTLGIQREMAMIAPESMGAIADGLARDNLSDGHIQGIVGGNWLRIARQVWR